ncbi:GIY-YIG nuclease family protein [Sphingobacterium hungaricum]|uniref:Excinuclease ABC subunit C n=1 Tax=Sphingobacterium hungaricum TaxID=2082723 RepID=A0A928UVF0_9SPHI|nr:GIY-YIG nuclease family protein [Sphingobacterium hungaricum]MBE8712608.1 excinuclease ABC subunit C [Sphingobacterium hungaricum]
MVYGGYVYIMTNKNNTTFYIGVTSDLYSRVYEHKHSKYPKSFTSKYKCFKLVWYSSFTRIEEAIEKEKQLKNWHRDWKINLIKESNPRFLDLWEETKNF